MAAAFSSQTSETVSQGGADEHIVITLIDPSLYPVFAKTATRNIVTFKDLVVASGLLVLPPVQDSLEPLSLTILLELCESRQVGIVTSLMAKEMRYCAHQRDPTSTEAVFENFAMTPTILEVTEGVTLTPTSQGGGPDLNDKSPMGIKTLIVALYQRWARHVQVSGQPDEETVLRRLSRSIVLETITWHHPRVQSPDTVEDTVENPIFCRDQICFNVPGIQGLALGRYFGKHVCLSITGLPLAGFARRVALYTANCNKLKADKPPDGLEDSAHDDTCSLHILQSSVQGLFSLHFVVDSYSRVTNEDMAALKQILLAAPLFESLAIVGDPLSHSDGFAGAPLPGSSQARARSTATGNDEPSTSEFYLPPFRFEKGERLPPLRRLQLWRYDWRCHSEHDVRTHWDLSRLRSLMLDEIPLRWFLGTIEMEQLRDLIALRLEDAEWAIQPGEARQAALMISLLLTHYIDRLEWLELIGVYTDNLPILAIRRHSSTLERLALRHPYGLGLNVDATTPSAIPLLLMALLQQEEDGASTPKASQLCQSSARPPIDPCTNAETSSKGSKDTPSQGKNEGNVAGCLAPALSCLASLELDMDERHMEQGDEPKILARLVRLPMLRSVALAVPSVLSNLNYVPKYDTDLHNVLSRVLYIINQRQQCMSKQQYSVSLEHRSDIGGPPAQPLERITFYIDGYAPVRGNHRNGQDTVRPATRPNDEKDNFWQTSGEPHSAEAENVRALMVALVTQVSHYSISSRHRGGAAGPSSSELCALYVGKQRTPFMPMASQFLSSEEDMTSILDRGPGIYGLSFLQPSVPTEVDATPGIAPGLILRSHGLRTQRCIIAELFHPIADIAMSSDGRHLRVPPKRGQKRDHKGKGKVTEAESNASKDSSQLVYHLYEEHPYDDEDDSPLLTYFQRRDLRDSNLRPRQRVKLPFVIRFSHPANLPAPRWDMLGVPLWN